MGEPTAIPMGEPVAAPTNAAVSAMTSAAAFAPMGVPTSDPASVQACVPPHGGDDGGQSRDACEPARDAIHFLPTWAVKRGNTFCRRAR
jgi:hypothetical protein